MANLWDITLSSSVVSITDALDSALTDDGVPAAIPSALELETEAELSASTLTEDPAFIPS